MKRILMVLTVGVAVLTGCTATNSSKGMAQIAGTWKGYATMEEWRSTLVLAPDGKYRFVSGRSSSDTEEGSWSTKGDEILFDAVEPSGRGRSFRFSTEFKNSLNFYESKEVSGKESSHVEAGMWELAASNPVAKEQPAEVVGHSWWAAATGKNQVVDLTFPTDFSGNNEQKFVLTFNDSPSNGGGVKGTYTLHDGQIELTFDPESAQLNGESCNLRKFAKTNPYTAGITIRGTSISLDKPLEGKLYTVPAGTSFQQH